MIRTLARLVVSALILLVAGEAAARAFWRFNFNLSLREPQHVLFAFYPELRRMDAIRPSRDHAVYDVLMLGESVVHSGWGEVERALVERFAREGHHTVRMSNLAVPGHTSRDSLLKYAAAPDARFDLVIVYDGINETRANNAPPDVFRDDYGHYPWYEVVNAMAPYHGTARMALPYTLTYLAIRMRQTMYRSRYMPAGGIRDEWAEFGKDARSAVSFERNLGAILNIASGRGDRVMLMTVATSVPDDYSLQAFQDRRLDYDLHASPIEMWGRKADVVNTIARHNDVIRRLAARTSDVLFVDQAALMPGGKMYFNDICHLTVVGSLKFVENLFAVLRPSLDSR